MSRILAFSDVHIGYEDTNYPAFHEFLDYVESNKSTIDKVVMVGDILDLWRIDYNGIKSDHVYNDAFMHLQSTIDELAANDVETIFINGNHDYAAGNIIGDDLNVEYKNLYILDNIVFTHGWEFDLAQQFFFFDWLVTPYVYELITRFFPSIYQHFCRKPSEIPTSEYAANFEWIDSIRKKALNYSHKIGVPLIVIGHRHQPEISPGFVDCGDFIDSLSWCEIDDGVPTLHKWRDMEMKRE